MPSKTRSFPSGSETASLLNTFGVFWLGALMRSVGAIDQIGLRQGLIIRPSIMAIGTIIIAFSRYATIGIAAPVMAPFGQLLQRFSAGVEAGGVSVYLSEIATTGSRGFDTRFSPRASRLLL
ncbi:MFS family permease [Bradyrhizobium sp. RT4a]